MSANSAEYQRNYRFLRKNDRKEEVSLLLKILDELQFLRKILTEDKGSNGSLRKVSPDPSKESLSLTPKTIIRSLDNEFEEVWPLFPRLVGKGAARKAYRTARKKVAFDTLVAGVRKLASENETSEARFIPHPATWLNQERWSDVYANGHDHDISEYRAREVAEREAFRKRLENPHQ